MQARALDAVERNAQVQVQLVDDLLDVSRIISGKLRVKAEPVDLATVIARAIDTVRPAVTARNQTLDVIADPATHALVTGDEGRLQQVVWNLLSNAVKFTPAGGHIRVDLRTADGCAELLVTDTGEGMPPEILPHLFERFWQADRSTTRKHGGLGIGLSIVRHLTEAHGGSVAVDSGGPGQGSTFIVRLPLRDEQQKPV
jgi:signal transduction histidine kinase